jgi:hypothetical protein
MALKNYPIVTVGISIVALTVQLVHTCAGSLQNDSAFGLYLLVSIMQVSQGTFCLAVYLMASYMNRRRKVVTKRLASQGVEGLRGNVFLDARPMPGEKHVYLDRYSANGTTEDESFNSRGVPQSESAVSSSLRSQNDSAAVDDFEPGEIVEYALDTAWRCFCGRRFHGEESDGTVLLYGAKTATGGRLSAERGDNSSPLFRKNTSVPPTDQSSSKFLSASYNNALYGQDQSFIGQSIFSSDGGLPNNSNVPNDNDSESSNLPLFDSLLVASQDDRRKVSTDRT